MVVPSNIIGLMTLDMRLAHFLSNERDDIGLDSAAADMQTLKLWLDLLIIPPEAVVTTRGVGKSSWTPWGHRWQ